MTRALIALALAACARPPALAHRGTLSFGGLERSYSWAGPDEGRRPLIIALHGRGDQGDGQAQLSHLDAIARREGFIVVFPDGIKRSWADGRGTTPAVQRGVDDVGFIAALIDRFVADGRADPARVYATGMSNGAMMTWTLACKLADRLAAVAPVAGGMPSFFVCAPSRPVPVLYFAGTADPFIPYRGGATRGGGDVLSAEESVARWARLDGCSGEPAIEDLPDVDPADGTRVRARRWAGCGVELITIEGGGHTWPGGKPYAPDGISGKTSRDIDASEEMWRFFSRFHR